MIILSGDSWGLGGFSNKSIGKGMLGGPGFINYVNLHHSGDITSFNFGTTVNLSCGGLGNVFNLEALKKFLKKYSPDETDQFFFIVTDPMRCVTTEDLLQQVSSANSLKLIVETVIHKFLTNLNALATEYNIKIQLIGGLCDLNEVNFSSYTNLIKRIPSWGQLIDIAYPVSIYSSGKLIELGKTLCRENPALLDEWANIVDCTRSKHNWTQSNPRYFLQDHPTAEGHRLLRDAIFPEFKHLF